MYEYIVRNKWVVVLAAVFVALIALQALVSHEFDQDAVSDEATASAEAPPAPAASPMHAPDAATDADDDSNQDFATDDELIENPQGEDPSAGLDGDQSAGGDTDRPGGRLGDPPPDYQSNNNGGGDYSSDGGDE